MTCAPHLNLLFENKLIYFFLQIKYCKNPFRTSYFIIYHLFFGFNSFTYLFFFSFYHFFFFKKYTIIKILAEDHHIILFFFTLCCIVVPHSINKQISTKRWWVSHVVVIALKWMSFICLRFNVFRGSHNR